MREMSAVRGALCVDVLQSLKEGFEDVVLDRAAQPMQTELGTLNAIHLASALLRRDAAEAEPIMAIHDGALGLAAQSKVLWCCVTA